MNTQDNLAWANIIGRDCAKRAAARWGSGWRMLSEEQREAAVCREIVSVLLSQDEGHAHKQILHLQAATRAAFERAGIC